MISPGDSDQAKPEEDRIFLVSPDGDLALTMEIDIDGECLLGFHGFEWRQQGSVLSEQHGTTVDLACQTFIKQVIEDQAIIAVLSRHGERTDIWITEAPDDDLEYLQEGESILFRYWSGRKAR